MNGLFFLSCCCNGKTLTPGTFTKNSALGLGNHFYLFLLRWDVRCPANSCGWDVEANSVVDASFSNTRRSSIELFYVDGMMKKSPVSNCPYPGLEVECDVALSPLGSAYYITQMRVIFKDDTGTTEMGRMVYNVVAPPSAEVPNYQIQYSNEDSTCFQCLRVPSGVGGAQVAVHAWLKSDLPATLSLSGSTACGAVGADLESTNIVAVPSCNADLGTSVAQWLGNSPHQYALTFLATPALIVHYLGACWCDLFANRFIHPDCWDEVEPGVWEPVGDRLRDEESSRSFETSVLSAATDFSVNHLSTLSARRYQNYGFMLGAQCVGREANDEDSPIGYECNDDLSLDIVPTVTSLFESISISSGGLTVTG